MHIIHPKSKEPMKTAYGESRNKWWIATPNIFIGKFHLCLPTSIQRGSLSVSALYTRSIMNVSRPPRGATVAFRLLGESAPRRPAAWDGLACWAGPDQTADCWMNLDRRDPADPDKGGEGKSAGSGDNGMRRIPAAARTVCFGAGAGYFGTVP